MAKAHNAHVIAYRRYLRKVARDNMLRIGLRIGQVPGVLVRKGKKAGELEWRWEGKAGASYPTHPLDVVRRRMESKFRAGLVKVERIYRMDEVTTRAGKARSSKGAETVAAVLALAAAPNVARLGRGMATHIAGRVGVGVRQVRAILKQRKAEATEKG